MNAAKNYTNRALNSFQLKFVDTQTRRTSMVRFKPDMSLIIWGVVRIHCGTSLKEYEIVRELV